MEGLTKKLNIFSELVLKDATQQRDELIKAVEAERNERLTQKENEFLQRAYEEIQATVADVKKSSNSKLLQAELDSKKQLLIKREQIINDVMDEAEKRLREFKNSADYKKWLLDTVSQAFSEVGNGSKTVYIAAEDLQYKSEMENNDEITVEAAQEHDFLGGVKVYNSDRRIAVDYSFKEMLSEQKSEFLQKSGLTLG